MKKRYGLLAHPVKHSLSPVMYDAAFEVMGLDAHYEVFDVPPEGLGEFMKRAVSENITGLSVSLPHKEAIIPYLKYTTADVRAIGATNTVVYCGNNEFFGLNTDYKGALKAIKERYKKLCGRVNLKDKIVVLLGAGGSSRAIAYALLKAGAHVWVKNRTKEKSLKMAVDFAEMFRAEIHADDWESLNTGDILINTTSFWLNNKGISEDELPFFCNREFLREFEVVMDISYNNGMDNFPHPLKTPLILAAEEERVATITGEKMLLHQAVEQFKYWFDEPAPVWVMKEALEAKLASTHF
ncbi:shikimate dehydrogenase [Candidatus Peregrinibacteria bacterium]|nr:shikimate dehydrogenase [Candidatus Peregrinibacteria bacterium]